MSQSIESKQSSEQLITAPEFNPQGIKYGFLTKNIPESSHKYVLSADYLPQEDGTREISNNHEKALRVFGVHSEKISVLKQIHGNAVHTVDHHFAIGSEPEGDTQVTDKQGIVLGVITADCVPVIFIDEERKIVATAHAGWKGARAGVIESAVRAILDSGAKDITAIVGPCIKQVSYEVDTIFYSTFVNDTPLNNGYFIASNKAGHYLFNLTAYVKDKLSVLCSQVYDVSRDTLAESDVFFSYRRSTHNKIEHIGSLISLVVIE
jgi:purine-nucleoside/S-methyl-5'-thioadenosine phosphorylase / adenosine deaminase